MVFSVTDELKKLGDLRDQGLLSDSEFQTQKHLVLGQGHESNPITTQTAPLKTQNVDSYAFDKTRIARWRPWIEAVGLLVAIGELINVVGHILNAVTGSVPGWQRVANLGNTVSIGDVGIVAVALLMVVGVRVTFQWPLDTPGASGKTTLAILSGLITWFLTSFVLSILASTAGNHTTFTLNLDHLGQLAAVVINVGLALASVGILVAVTYSWRLFAATVPMPFLPPSLTP